MAEDKGRGGGRKPKPAAKPKAERVESEYVVLRRLRLHGGTDFISVYDLPPEDPSIETIRASLQDGVWLPIVEPDGQGGHRVRKITATHGEKAVEAVTGKGDGAVAGEWKFVAWSAWKGVTRVDEPLPILKDQRSTSDDE